MPEKPYQQSAPGPEVVDAPVMERWCEIYADVLGHVLVDFCELRHGKPRLTQRYKSRLHEFVVPALSVGGIRIFKVVV